MDLFLTDSSNGYHLSGKGIKTFVEIPIGVEKKVKQPITMLKNRLSETLGSIPDLNVGRTHSAQWA